ncbi:MAG: replicative DNA helicase, partial [Candidatus Aminicenantes bacterium]|nr:replicative DNA helicase [Candidatus Aminicenantes bacterium]
IEQDADVVMFLHREEQVNQDTEKKGEADLFVAKQRNGPTGKVVLAFMAKYTKFGNLEHREYDEEGYM